MTAKRLKIGVTLLIHGEHQSLWENGIFQNCVFLADLLKALPSQPDVYVVCVGGEDAVQHGIRFLDGLNIPVMSAQDAQHQLNVLIELSSQMGGDWVNAFRQRGGRVVTYCVGNDFALDAERLAFGLPAARLVPHSPRDAVWTLPQYARIGAPYYAATFRAPVSLLPHLWSPDLFERAAALKGRQDWAYRPHTSKRWRVAIVEPNLSVVKTSHLPLLACEYAHRIDANLLEHVYVFNTIQFKSNAVFSAFCSSLDVVKHQIATFEGRLPLYDILGHHAEAIVSHQWENAQNYVHYETLHGGYPLIHNSHLLGNCGYRYHGFDCEEAGRVLIQARAEHDSHLSAYRAKAQAFLATLHPHHPANVAAYAQAIERLWS